MIEHNDSTNEKYLNSKEYSLTVTYRCNWFCTYCISDTHAHPEKISLADVKRRVELIEPVSTVDVTGGEPGVASAKIIDWVMKELQRKDCEINVNTNGKFIERYGHKYDDYVHEYFYHCSEKLDLDQDIAFYPHVTQSKICYVITVDDESFNRLGAFLDKYPNIQFYVQAASKVNSSLPGRTWLSKSNALKILQMYKDRLDPKCFSYIYSTCIIENERKPFYIQLK